MSRVFGILLVGLLSLSPGKSAFAMDFKCYWEFGVRTDSVTETMDQSKRGFEAGSNARLRGDGGYQDVSANQFSYSSGSKAVEMTDKVFGFDGVKLFTNGNLKVSMKSGPFAGQDVARYKCEKNSIDVIEYLKSMGVAPVARTKSCSFNCN